MNDKAPLSERFTLVLLSHNRKAFMRRTLQYYSTYPCSILVLDSSLEADESLAQLYPQVDYRHLPQFGYKGLHLDLRLGAARPQPVDIAPVQRNELAGTEAGPKGEPPV